MGPRPFRIFSFSLLIGAAAFALGTLSASAQETTGDELFCQLKSSAAIGKFIRSKAQCIENCYKSAFVSQTTPDCSPPYDMGPLQGCVNQSENKAGGAVNSNCHDCPECYAADACNTNGNPHVAAAEAHVDALASDVFCDDSASVGGLTGNEFVCQRTVRKFVTAFAAAKLKCYAKCRKAEIGGKTDGPCGPPAADTRTMACIDKAETKAASSIDTKCESSESASADKPECGPYPTRTGADWVAAEEAAVDTQAPDLFCNDTTTTTTVP